MRSEIQTSHAKECLAGHSYLTPGHRPVLRIIIDDVSCVDDLGPGGDDPKDVNTGSVEIQQYAGACHEGGV